MRNRLEKIFPRNRSNAQNLSQGWLESTIYLFFPFLLISYFIGIGSGTSVDDHIAPAILLLGLALLIKNRATFAPKEVRIIYILGGVLAIMSILHAFLGNDMYMLFKLQFAKLRNMLMLPMLAALLIVLRLNAQAIWRLILLAGSYTTVLVVLILIEEPIRGEGLFKEVIVMGNLGMLFGLLALVALLGVKGAGWKILAVVVFLSGVGLSFLSGTRGGWLALIIGYIVLIWGLWGVNRVRFNLLVGLLIATFLAVYLLWEYLPIQSRIEAAFRDVDMYFEGNSNTSLGGRFDLWKVAFTAFLEKPVFGWGVVPYRQMFVEYANAGLINFDLSLASGHVKNGYIQPHNDYLLILYYFGLVGFTLVMSLLFYPVWVLVKAMRKAKKEGEEERVYLALTGLIVIESLMEFMLSNVALMNEIFYVVIFIVFLVLIALSHDENKEALQPSMTSV